MMRIPPIRIYRPHMRWLLLLLLAALLFTALNVRPARAQNYSFQVPSFRMQVFVQDDSQVRIVYDITFRNDQFADPIDIVDIGTPNADYDISNMLADIDGVPLDTIRPSEFVTPGVEIPLGSQEIAPGTEGTLHFEMTIPNLVFGDTTRDDFASLQITPTWFDPSLVSGPSNLEIAILLPPQVTEDEVLFQDVPFTDRVFFDDRQVVVWRVPDWSASEPYRVGVSFADRGLTGVIRLNAFQLLVKFIEDNPLVHFTLMGLFVILAAVLFFRFSGNTGWSVFIGLLVVLYFCVLTNPGVLLISFLPLPLLFFFNERSLHKRKNTYLPAIAQVEGGGIKRGLTAPEAAVILELPINKVLMLTIFGMLKKEMLQQVRPDPLTVEVTEPFQARGVNNRAPRRAEVAQERGVILHRYENSFLDRIQDNPDVPLQELDFSDPLKRLIEHAATRVKDFDLSDTQDYYRSIIQRALKQAETIGDIEQREKTVDRNLEWILMNDGYGDVFDPYPSYGRRRYSYIPIWLRRSATYGSSDSMGGSFGDIGGAPDIGGTTSFGDVAASFAGWTENTMGGLADAIAPGSLQVSQGASGVIDLSGADRVTGDVLEALAESSSSGGGGGGGCACAGCACACACAGGGR